MNNNKFCQKINIGRILVALTFLLMGAFVLAGCGKDEKVSALPSDCVYYLNREETKIVPVSLAKTEYDMTGDDTEAAIDEAIKALCADPEDASLKKTLGAEVTLNSFTVESGVMMLDFDRNYYDLANTTEVLFRAAMVRTFCAIEGIDSVSFSVEGDGLTDDRGEAIGSMRADNFIDNAGDEMNAYEETTLTLYFAAENGTMLEKEVRNVEYSSNISKEKLVLEQLIAGPEKRGLGFTIAPERKINSVTTKDGVCYVNLGDLTIDSLSLQGSVAEEVSVYSIVNSLCELPNINKVQIAIDGDTDRLYRDKLPLDKAFERNLDIVVTK